MRFFELIRQSAAAETPALSGAYLLHGEEEYSKEQAMRQALGLVGEAARALNTQRLSNPACADVQAACETLPFFDRCRVVIVQELSPAEEEALAAYAPTVPPTTILLFLQRGAAKKTSPLYKAMDRLDRVIEFPRCDVPRATAFLKKRASTRGVALSPIVCHRLIEMVGLDMAALESALYRVADYVGAGQPVTEAALSACITPSTEYRVFDLLSRLLAGNRREGLRMLQGMLQSGESALGLASFLAGQLKLMLAAKRMLSAGMTEAAAAKALGLKNPYAAKKTVQEAKKCAENWLCRAVCAFAQVDAQVKQGLMRDTDALFLAVLEVFRPAERAV